MRLLKWLKNIFSPHQEPKRTDLRQTGTHLRQTGKNRSSAGRAAQKSSRPGPEFVGVDPSTRAEIESDGPGKKVRIKHIREETGTHDKLKIVDYSLIETDEESGIDPYNTGQFDRSKNWNSRFGK